MMRQTLALIVTCLAAVLAGCHSDPPSAFAVAMPARIDFARSGGIAGGTQAMTIASDGAFTIGRGEAEGQPYAGRLPEPVLARVRGLVAEVDWDDVQRHYLEPRGADAYTYTLTLTAAGTGERLATAATDASLPSAPAELAELIRYLDGLMGQLAPER